MIQSTQRSVLAVAVLLFCSHAAIGQVTVEDLLPPSMRLDAKGLLQWSDAKPQPCATCAGSGDIECEFCADDPEGKCVACEADRKIRCTACAGKRVTPDAYVSQRCALCRGHGARGTRDEVEQCPLCAGAGRIAIAKVAGKSPRELDAASLERTVKALRAAATRLEEGRLPSDAKYSETKKALSAMLRESLGAAGVSAERIAALVAWMERSANRDPEELAMGSSFARMELAGQLRAHLKAYESCLWRVQYNARRAGPAQRKTVAASTVRWSGIMGDSPDDPATVYCMLGTGFFRAQQAPDTDDRIAAWLKAHPKAIVVPVTTLSGISMGRPDSRMVYCWVTDDGASLNLHLVEHGCMRYETMGAPHRRVEVDIEIYRDFLNAAKKAGDGAQKAKRGIYGTPSAKREDAEAAAHRHMNAGEYAKALEQFKKVASMGGRRDPNWLAIAERHGHLDQYDEALAAYDRAIGDAVGWPPYLARAKYMEEAKGAEAAEHWLGGLGKAAPNEHRYPSMVGSFHMEARRPAKAIPHYKRSVELASKVQGFVFGKDHMLVLDKTTLAKSNNDFAELWPTLEYLAWCCYVTGDRDGTLRYATMGISIGQQLNRCKGYYEAKEIEAGDCRCRLLRAQVYLDRRQLGLAQKEIDMAKVLADRGNVTPWKKAVRKAQEALDKLRPK